jgi:hypothetical protein
LSPAPNLSIAQKGVRLGAPRQIPDCARSAV